MSNQNHHPDHARPIPTRNDYRLQHRGTPRKRSWKEAAGLFVHDHKVGLLKKFATRYLPVGFLPVGVLDNVTGIGVADDPLTVAFFLWILYKINKYRDPDNDK